MELVKIKPGQWLKLVDDRILFNWFQWMVAADTAMVAVLALRLRFLVVFSQRCTRCGAAYCGRCVRGETESELCGPCHQSFTRQEGLEPAARQRQLHLIENNLRRLAWGRNACQIIWPGLALIHEGRTLAGFVEAALWAFLVIGALAPGRLLPVDPTPGVWAPWAPYAVAAALFWLLAQTPALRPRSVALRAGR